MRNDHVVEDQSAVFAFLVDPATHDGAAVTRLDTHGAAVFLAGADAYKVKRAVDFPFMDFSTLDRRREACAREVAINRPNAPGIYLGARAIVLRDGALALGPLDPDETADEAGEIVEWLVHMRRFDETQTLDRIAASSFTPPLLAALARAVAKAHARAEPAPADFDSVAALGEILADNATALAEAPDLFPPAQVAALTGATDGTFSALRPLLTARAAEGFVRRCHGDLHLRNIALIDGRPVLFDAIEFNPALATCDLLYDLAFLLMDLCARDLRPAANAVLNRYLWAADEDAHYSGLAALPLFLSARAAIRAKVGAPALAAGDEAGRTRIRAYFAAAREWLASAQPRLIGIGGLSGTGKSTLAAALAPELGLAPGAVILRSDVERKTLAGVPETERLPAAAYTPDATAAVYARLRHRAGLALAAGWTVIVDGVHARAEERDALAEVARACGAPFEGLWLEAPKALLAARVATRRNDASDATADIVEAQAGYHIGPMSWRRLDAGGGLEPTLTAARSILSALNGAAAQQDRL
ncbi:AAA family ATPase [Xanthobacteraceae bacterium A53D]